MKKYLQEHGSEVINMIFGDGEYDRDMDIAVNRREAWEDGHEEGIKVGMERGREEGLELTVRNALAKGISVQTIQEITGLSLDRINEIKQ